ncbi:hypothetical protein GCM10029963_46760 [Micromonospora andamanensis]
MLIAGRDAGFVAVAGREAARVGGRSVQVPGLFREPQSLLRPPCGALRRPDGLAEPGAEEGVLAVGGTGTGTGTVLDR